MPSAAVPVARPQAWCACEPERLVTIRGVFTDIDDTLTRAGAIEPEALTALQALKAAGLAVVAITGRPLGWSIPCAQAWPVDAIVAENGAVALRRDASARQGLRIDYTQDAPTRERNARGLQAAARRILREVPGAGLARDSAGRHTDIAIDHSEFAQLGSRAIQQVLTIMREAGMTATVSSIHINGWFGDHSKWTGAQWMLRALWGRELAHELDRWLFVGDSTNDQLMFEHFPLSVGVANLAHFAAQLRTWPAYITLAERGRGFAEVAGALLAARRS